MDILCITIFVTTFYAEHWCDKIHGGSGYFAG